MHIYELETQIYPQNHVTMNQKLEGGPLFLIGKYWLLRIQFWSWLNFLLQRVNYTAVFYEITTRYNSGLWPIIYCMQTSHELVFVI